MPKRKEQKFNENNRPVRKSEFDPTREAFMDGQGNYTYNRLVERENGKVEMVPVIVAKIGEDDVTAEITIVLDDMDCEDDRRNNQIRKHRDKVFEEQCAAYDAAPADENGDKRTDPWDKVSYQAAQGTDILDRIFPEDKPVDARISLLRSKPCLTAFQNSVPTSGETLSKRSRCIEMGRWYSPSPARWR